MKTILFFTQNLAVLIGALLTASSMSGQNQNSTGQNPNSTLKQSYLFHEYTTNGRYSPQLFPFLLEDANARVAGFGSIESVANPLYLCDGNTFNPALLSRRVKTAGATYTQSGYKGSSILKFHSGGFHYSFNDKNVVAFHLKYLRYDEITFTDINGYAIGRFRPKSYSAGLSYAHHLDNGLSLGSAINYISVSDYRYDLGKYENHFIAFDLGINYDKQILKTQKTELSYSLGASLNNLGPKVSVVENVDKDFLPAQMSIGAMLSDAIIYSETAKICFDVAYEIDKYLVPTPPIYGYDSWGIEPQIMSGKDPNVSAFRSYFQSFYDAPGGFKEEMQELIHQLGIEGRLHSKNLILAFRFGLFRQHKEKGDLKYNTLGVGAVYRGFYLNYSIHYDTDRGLFKGNELRYVKYFQVGYNYKF
ncbi:MAG: PorV/PorQ family protein [Bacteroidales bacterium]|nr:PorV/PorQ family protein [Bacteroidales bacterium]MCF8455878.1 PorV/PorQ family protein [Bacteroidales bacterium]